ncbi:hypothetical protein EDM56_08075 [Brevibacillus fluminis]|uniref:Transcription initiation factor TFIID n=1 Tax=Brevibacillus fluminis TaxID=511487 RepID=A0A3M8DQP3_9BACL|nr:hypothetical protein [Brevibacillus fluminis]RNB90456.1 hypothetical protein EDM56_08075 [Brevibacillus fluminis]
MRELVNQFAHDYVLDLERRVYSGDEQRRLNNPVVFLFVGDKSLEALVAIHELNRRKWSNSASVAYVHAYTAETSEREHVYSFRLPRPDADKKTIRKELHQQFYQDEAGRYELNRLYRQVSSWIGEHGTAFASFQKINIAVVTRVDDVSNVLLPELTLLAKSIFQESFKNVQIDLYALIKEKSESGEFGYAASLGISFLQELDRYQNADFTFRADLQVTEDKIKLPVEHAGGPLFSLAYLLGDKNERGVLSASSMKENYELISNLNLLKNRQYNLQESELPFSGKNEGYNEAQFIRNIMSGTTKNAYASAGFAKVSRPSKQIAFTVLAAYYSQFLHRLQKVATADKRDILALLALDAASLQKKVIGMLPEESRLEGLHSLMSDRVSFGELKEMTLQEAEEALYRDGSQRFFVSHFVQPALERLAEQRIGDQLSALLNRNVIENEAYGFYHAYTWTSDSEQGIAGELHRLVKDTNRQLDAAKAELADVYRQRAWEQPFKKGGLFTSDKERVKSFIRYFFEYVYGKKYEILGLEIQLQLLQQQIGALEEIHARIGKKIVELNETERLLHALAQESLSETTDGFGKNMKEYYTGVVAAVMQEQEAKRGQRFVFEDRFLGSPVRMLTSSMSELISRFIEVCRSVILPSEPFQLLFEEELLRRANVAGHFEQREILSKESLFKELYHALEDNAAIHIEVFHYAQKHRYEETYFFADFSSEFIRFAFDYDKGTRTYKLGCIHEKRSSGIEKMKLMGGFHMDDLMYVRNGRKYYDSYVANGYQFHGETPERDRF